MSTTEQDNYEARISKLRFACAALAEEMGHMREQRKDEVSRLMFLDQTDEIDKLRLQIEVMGANYEEELSKARHAIPDQTHEIEKLKKERDELKEKMKLGIKWFCEPNSSAWQNISDNEPKQTPSALGTMNLYLIKRVDDTDRDEMAAMVIAAESEAQAQELARFDGAATTTQLIGIAAPGISGVVCEDFING